jgi:hypothetical protein
MQASNWRRRIVGIVGAVFLLVLVSFLIFALYLSRKGQSSDASWDVLKINVEETGLHEVGLDDLRVYNQAIDSLSAGSLRLSQGGTSIPYFLKDDSLFFYGVAPASRYTSKRPYLLSLTEPGILMTKSMVSAGGSRPVDTITDTIHLEENNQYDSRSIPAGETHPNKFDPWYWATIQNDSEISIDFGLSEVDEDSSAFLRTALYGATSISPVDPDHDVVLYLNGILVDTITWDGETHITVDSLVEPGIVTLGTNTLVIDNHNDDRDADNELDSSGESSRSPLDIIRLDWVEIEYSRLPKAIDDQVILERVSGDFKVGGFSGRPKVIEITNPMDPKEVTGWNYENGDLEFSVDNESTLLATGPQGIISPEITPVRVSDWHDTSIQADLIILSADELGSALTPLVAWREEQGLGVVQVSVEDVYNEFGDGEESPDSISNFIQYALSEWRSPKPSYLLLVGEASYDYRNYLGELGQNVIPAPMVRVEYGGETVSDARLADADLDGLPDIAIGRWPVSTRNEVSELVERTIAYEQGPGSDNVLMAADGTSQEFTSLSDEILASSGLSELNVRRLYGVPADRFTDAWNDGAWLVSYVGHGSIDRWGKNDVFAAGAVPDLNSDSSPPIVIQLTCLTGFYAHPTVDSISELMLRHDKGPVEIIAATSLTLSSSQRPFGVNLIKALQDREVIRIGDALQQAKAALDIERNRELREISETFTLLGDPSALIVRP